MDQAGCDRDMLGEQIVRFFRQHREEWRKFVSEFVPASNRPPLQVMAKFFVIRSNQPFDMQAYMRAQAEFIRESMNGNLETLSAIERQKMVAEWLRHHAQSHRDQIILEQARCIEQCADLIDPVLSELLEEPVSAA